MPEHKLALIAYCEHDGVRSMTDSYVENLYLRAEEEGLTDMVFMDGSLPNSVWFLEDMKHRSHLFVVSCDAEVAGFVWINNIQGRTAYCHFCLYRDFWGKQVPELERFSLTTLLNLKDNMGEYMFDMLLGNTPLRNWHACRRMRTSTCLQVMGELPFGYFNAEAGESIPSLLAYATRESLEVNHG